MFAASKITKKNPKKPIQNIGRGYIFPSNISKAESIHCNPPLNLYFSVKTLSQAYTAIQNEYPLQIYQ